MFGVILWSDPASGQAVIWCEDAGNLAYYQAPGSPHHLRFGFFDAGDYVEFEVTQDDRLRRASNAQRVQAERAPRVQETLLRRGSDVEDGRRQGRRTGPRVTASDAPAGATAVGRRFSHHG